MFTVIWTDTGLAKRAAALAGGDRVQIVEMALGDGNGQAAAPDAAQTELVNEVWRGDVNALEVRPPATTVVTVEATVPAADGPFDVREVGLFDAAGDLVAVGDVPLIEKPAPGDGAVGALYVRATLETIDPDAALELIVDPATVMASREYVDPWLGVAQLHAWRTYR